MRHWRLPSEVQERLQKVFKEHKKKEMRIPGLGDCFFLEAPTLTPQENPDHALTTAISKAGEALVCVKISLEYWEASEHDYMLDAEEWTGRYPALVEVWNSVVFSPREPLLIHAVIPPSILELLREIFMFHQRRQSPPRDFKGIGKPMPEDPHHPMWAFRAREAEIMERVRRHYHEGWDVRLVRLPVRRISRTQELRMAASTDDLAVRLEKELEAQKYDVEILGPPRLSSGQLFVRRDGELPGYKLIWYSEQAAPPPQVSAHPALEAVEMASPLAVQTVIGSWREETLGKQILLEVAAEGAPTQVLIRIPRKRK